MHIGTYIPVYPGQNAHGAHEKRIGISEYDDSVPLWVSWQLFQGYARGRDIQLSIYLIWVGITSILESGKTEVRRPGFRTIFVTYKSIFGALSFRLFIMKVRMVIFIHLVILSRDGY